MDAMTAPAIPAEQFEAHVPRATHRPNGRLCLTPPCDHHDSLPRVLA